MAATVLAWLRNVSMQDQQVLYPLSQNHFFLVVHLHLLFSVSLIVFISSFMPVGFLSTSPVRNDNLDAPKPQNTESESNPGQNPLQTSRLIGWERNNPLLINEVASSPPGPKPLATLQDSASEPPVQDAGNFPKVPTPDTSGLPS
ncbi:hypothetical protein DSO57_1006274 [Entomophthora muscae]|uniref:Uncharacterized protein n=1 Tax=Entomophthora muscae TaxID=34485 RepID=A0ACC2TV53_9FUNG|nr:hypothetical protein DSO57_1006274 [Entomophthora muscae]